MVTVVPSSCSDSIDSPYSSPYESLIRSSIFIRPIPLPSDIWSCSLDYNKILYIIKEFPHISNEFHQILTSYKNLNKYSHSL